MERSPLRHPRAPQSLQIVLAIGGLISMWPTGKGPKIVARRRALEAGAGPRSAVVVGKKKGFHEKPWNPLMAKETILIGGCRPAAEAEQDAESNS